jgi:hypothetical protein
VLTVPTTGGLSSLGYASNKVRYPRSRAIGRDRDHESAILGVDAVFPNPRLCKALLDRITDPAHIVETGRISNLGWAK